MTAHKVSAPVFGRKLSIEAKIPCLAMNYFQLSGCEPVFDAPTRGSHFRGN